ncbi:MAG: sialate O-acetylesterase [Lentisphaeria bacterium]|nr:sialate O-acetylesterase [Lentisphaeria bacterium]
MIRGKTVGFVGLFLVTLGLCAPMMSQEAEAAPTEAAAPKPAIELGAPFCDNAVLQRDMPIPVWGWSAPGTTVTVEFAGQKRDTKAGEAGKWMLELDPLKASFEPAEMVISDDQGKTVTLKNILVGEVWMASGQSNMQWKVAKSSCNKLTVEPENGVNPIREFEVTSVYAMLHPIERATGAWKDGGYTDYSAIAFAFAHKLYEELGVPIGILNCSFSQTSIQAWVPRVGFRDGDDDYTKAIYQQILETDPATAEHTTAWNTFYQGIEEELKAGRAVSTKTPGNMNGNRDASWMFNGRLNPVIPYAIRGGIWNQGYANMGEGLPYYHNLHSLIRGWRIRWDNPELPVYFHQFYSPGNGAYDGKPSIGGTAEMRLGTALARDIPNANMASQIDIQGAIHYGSKAVPGQRLALHALKNQYPSTKLKAGGLAKDMVADGPMFKSYTVKGDKVIVEFDYADGGLVVAETRSNAVGRDEGATGFANPKIIENGDDHVKFFYLADENRVWYPASMTIDGDKVILTSPEVKTPRGVTYGTGGIGFEPNVYNKALLPMTPFIYYDNKLVTSETWPDEKLKIHGETIDPSTIGLVYEYRKMPILSTQFRDNAVLQAGVPVTIWGSAVHDWGKEAEGEAVIHFSFNGIEKTIPVTPGMREWQVTVPAMAASAEPKTLKVTFTIDGELAHERVAENIVIGDVWYVAAPDMDMTIPAVKPSGQIVRMIERQAKRDAHSSPSRFSVCVSTTPENRFASYWKDAEGLAAALGHSIASKTGAPVGVIFMQSNAGGKSAEKNPQLKSWFPPEYLNLAPSLMADYKDLAALRPGNDYYAENVHRYIGAWKTYWNDYIPEMITTKAVPDGATWGTYPSLGGEVESNAGWTYNVMVHSFTPAALKGIIFLASPVMVAEDQGANYGEQVAALANALKMTFAFPAGSAAADTAFVYTVPNKTLAANIAPAKGIQGKSVAVELNDWSQTEAVIETILQAIYP